MYTFIWGQTVRLWFKIKNPITGVFYDPDTSVTVTVYNPSGMAIVTSQDMTKDTTGAYYYDYDTTLNVAEGIYTAIASGVDSTHGTNMDSDKFAVEVMP